MTMKQVSEWMAFFRVEGEPIPESAEDEVSKEVAGLGYELSESALTKLRNRAKG